MIEIKGITKFFGKKPVVEDVSVTIETGKITSQAAGFVHFEIFGNILSGAHADGSRHIDVSGGKKPTVYIGIQSSFGFHEFVSMADSNVMKRLSFYQKR